MVGSMKDSDGAKLKMMGDQGGEDVTGIYIYMGGMIWIAGTEPRESEISKKASNQAPRGYPTVRQRLSPDLRDR